MNETLSIPIGVGTDRLYKRMDFISIQHQIRNIFHCKLSVYTELHFHFDFVFPADGLPFSLQKSNDLSEFLSCFSRPLHSVGIRINADMSNEPFTPNG